MKIKWLGHACFLLTSETGTRILTDPFDDQVGYPVPNEEADIVTTSHDHFDHNYIIAVKNPKEGTFLHLNNPGRYNRNGIMITGVSTYHDQAGGKKRGRNVIFVIDIDGLRICHCGDLGHIPDGRQTAEIGRIDMLLLPVGGIFTVNAAEAYQVVNLLKPSVTVPMHYKTPAVGFNVDGVDKFLSEAGLSGRMDIFAHKQEIEVTKANIKTLPEIIVLDYK